MTAPPTISVLVPTFNRAGTLEQCIGSLAAGGHDRLQVVISDNASTDGTQAIAHRLAAADPRITVIEHAANRGPLPNWRACLERASGDYVHWLWSDDWIEPGFYALLLEAMARGDRRVGLAAARVINPETGLWRIRYSMANLGLGRDELLALGLKGLDLPASPAAALLPIDSVRRHFTESIPVAAGLDCNRRAIGCDALMILGAILDHGGAAFRPEPLVNFRESASSISCATDPAALGAHYAWARIAWAKAHRLPRAWMAYDLLRLARHRRWTALARALI